MTAASHSAPQTDSSAMPRRTPPPPCPNSHRAKPSAVIPSSTASTASGSACCASTQTSQAAEANRGKASTCLKVFIQAPGLGSSRAAPGIAVSSR